MILKGLYDVADIELGAALLHLMVEPDLATG
jgi:hypothetical protein